MPPPGRLARGGRTRKQPESVTAILVTVTMTGRANLEKEGGGARKARVSEGGRLLSCRRSDGKLGGRGGNCSFKFALSWPGPPRRPSPGPGRQLQQGMSGPSPERTITQAPVSAWARVRTRSGLSGGPEHRVGVGHGDGPRLVTR